MAKVVVTDFIADALQPERDALGDLADVVAPNAFNEEALHGIVDDADALMVYHNLGIGQGTIKRLRNCKLIVRCGVGFDNVDYAFAATRGIPVANVPDYGTEEVADSAIGMALSLTRGVHFLNSRLRSSLGDWSYEQTVPLQRLRGRVFGIIGLGRIGIATAYRARALGMDVWYYDPYRDDGFDKAVGIQRAETLRELLERCYVLSVHCPLTPETRQMLNRETLSWLPAGSYLVNTARGAVVVTDDLPELIESGQLAGASIDVLDGEPPRNDNRLVSAWRDPNHPCHHRVIVNPHSAFYSEQGLLDMRIKGSRACRRAILGEPIPNVVNGVFGGPR